MDRTKERESIEEALPSDNSNSVSTHSSPAFQVARRMGRHWVFTLVLVLLAFWYRYYAPRVLDLQSPISQPLAVWSKFCPQTEALHPRIHAGIDGKLRRIFADERYKVKAYETLGGAVRVPTESYDDLGPVGEDDRWKTFGRLHEYLEDTFPRVYEHLQVTKVNTYGIVLHWQGSDTRIAPVLMTAHQDVVPVDPVTVDQWLHPPYSGFYDGTWIWGRGSCDDKSNIIASLQAIDLLLDQGFQPERTFVWAYGFDEEASGTQGAGQLAIYLEQTYGTNGFALLVDEGGSYGTPFGDSVIFVAPALSEKGYIDVRIDVSTKGGHSSVPPKHTAIGILSAMVVEIESNPHDPALVRDGSPYNATLCAASYAPSYPDHLRELAFEATVSDEALARLKNGLLEAFPRYDAILRTTQAVDLIHGGLKVNALPEQATAVVNHRIAEHDSVKGTQQHLVEVLLPVARHFGLSMTAFGVRVNVTDNADSGADDFGQVALSDAYGTGLEPSPITPTGRDDPFQIFAGTVKATIESGEGYNASGVVVAPLLTIGNTDTRYYWNLTRNIIRYKHLHDRDRFNGAHTINEAVRAEGWIDTIRFHTKLILNLDEYI